MASLPQKWLRITLMAPPLVAEAGAELLMRLTGAGVETSESPDQTMVRAYLPEGEDAGALKARLEAWVGEQEGPGKISLAYDEIPAQDWMEGWKQHFHPREMSPGLWVAPPWEEAPLKDGDRVLVINPGQAFGTGQHETTLLCVHRLVYLAQEGRMPARVLDVGCGTGVLSLIALMLGAESALGLDIDPLAVEAAGQNAALNDMQGRLLVSETPVQEINESFPLVLANITAMDLSELAPAICDRLAPGGELMASGMLNEQVSGVEQVYQTLGLVTLESRAMGEWSSLIMEKP